MLDFTHPASSGSTLIFTVV